MRIVLVVDRNEEDPDLVAAVRATGAKIRRVHDIEEAIDAVRGGETDAVLANAAQMARLSRGPHQISSCLRHEMNQPLTTILGFAQLLAMGVNRDPIQDQLKLETIVEQTKRLCALVSGEEASDDDR